MAKKKKDLSADLLSNQGNHNFSENLSDTGIADENLTLQNPKKSKVKTALIFSGLALVIMALSAGLAVNYKNKKALERKVAKKESVRNTQEAKAELSALVETVSKLILLPLGEEPSLATVTDLAPLKDQLFFKNSKIGDKVLVYLKSGRAFLYRPDESKIIEVASFVPETGSESRGAVLGDGKIQGSLSLEVRNGSGKAGGAARFKEKFSTHGWLQFISLGNAQKDYPESLVVDLSKGQKSELVLKLAAEINARVVMDLPSEEKESNAEALVFLGANQ